MASPNPPPPKRSGMSLYADLLEPAQSGATISSAPVKYNVEQAKDDSATKRRDASLSFVPVRRPQPKAKPKGPPSSANAHRSSSSLPAADTPSKPITNGPPSQQPSIQHSTFDDWVADEDEEIYLDRPKYERGGRKKNKKKRQGQQAPEMPGWDEVYDPSVPNRYADYKGSEEQNLEIRDWKARLHYRRRKPQSRDSRSKRGSTDDGHVAQMQRPLNTMFAPPSFAPVVASDDAERDAYLRPLAAIPPPPHARAAISFNAQSQPEVLGYQDGRTEAAMQGLGSNIQQQPQPHAHTTLAASVPSAPPETKEASAEVEAKRAEALAKIAAFKAKLAAKAAAKQTPVPSSSPPPPPPPPPPPEDPAGPTISRAPIRYNVTPTEPRVDSQGDITMQDQDSPFIESSAPSTRPGQKGFAERLMKKYGWDKGQGLGAQGDGITTAIWAKREKVSFTKDDGTTASKANFGKMMGGRKRKAADEGGDAVDELSMSTVIKIEGMLESLDVDAEIQKEYSLYQEIGEYMGNDYGKVERIFVWRKAAGGQDDVFVKFASELSAFRAVSDKDGLSFAGNDVVAKFFDAEKFDKEEYV